MGFYPLCLEMNGRRCIVVGGGAVAERKVEGLLAVGADVTVISPALSEGLRKRVAAGAVHHLAREYRSGDLAGFGIVFAATDDAPVNSAVYADARAQCVWVNSADDPDHCDFILPSVLRRGDLAVAVSSGGKSPALARMLREQLETYFTQEHERLAALAAEARAELQKRSISAPFETWRKALSGDVRQLLMRGEVDRARSQLLKELGVSL